MVSRTVAVQPRGGSLTLIPPSSVAITRGRLGMLGQAVLPRCVHVVSAPPSAVDTVLTW